MPNGKKYLDFEGLTYFNSKLNTKFATYTPLSRILSSAYTPSGSDTNAYTYDVRYINAQLAQAGLVDDVKVNNVSVVTNKVANITVPTKVSELTNDSGFTTNTGTVTSVKVKMNGSTKGTITTSGEIDLGTVITSHQDISGKLDKNSAITGATKCKITYDAKGLVTSGADLTASDIPSLAASKITSGTFADGMIASASTWNGHVSNTSNPHSVTKAQVGLGNVENKSSATIRSEITYSNVIDALDFEPEDHENRVTSINSSSTDSEYPSAKCVYDEIQDVREVALGKTKTLTAVAYSSFPIYSASARFYKADGTMMNHGQASSYVYGKTIVTSKLTSSTNDLSYNYSNEYIILFKPNGGAEDYILLTDDLDEYLSKGDIILFIDVNLPDIWYGGLVEDEETYFYKLESTKVDLTGYVDELVGTSSNGVITGLIKSGHTLSVNSTSLAVSDTAVSGKYISEIDQAANGKITITRADLPTIPTLSKGTTTGSGNAVTDISVSGHTVTLTKGSTFALTSELADFADTRITNSEIDGLFA